MSCKAGKHRWPSGKGKPGEKCAKCGDPHRGRGRPSLKKAAPAARPPAPASRAAAVAGEDGAARLALAIGALPAAAAAPVVPDQVAPPTPAGAPAGAPAAAASDVADDGVEDVKSTAAWIARRCTKVLVGMTEWAIELSKKRRAGEADEEDEEQFSEGLARAIRRRWEDRGLSPAWQMALAGTFIVGEMCLTSEAIPQPVKPAAAAVAAPVPLVVPSPVNGASDADTTDAAIPLHD